MGSGLLALLFCSAAAAAVQPGKDYRSLQPPQPVETGKNVEVLEFFWYGCPHCYSLQPSFKAWLKKQPKDVELRRIPAVLADNWLPLTRTYYALDALDLVGKFHDAVFAAVHEKNIRLEDPKLLFDWVAKQGVDRQKFADVYQSFAVQNQTQRAAQLTRSYGVTGTPTIVVDGKYLTAPSMAGSYERFSEILDELVALARKSRSGKKN